MTLPLAIAYLSGLAFVAPDLPARAHHLEVAPGHALRPAGPERLHGRLLGREARRVAREAAAAAGLAVRLLRRGEDAGLEARAGAPFERAADARDVAHVDAQADDHGGQHTSTRRRCGRWRYRREASGARRTPCGAPREDSACRRSAR